MSLHVSDHNMFDPRNMPGFKRTEPAGIPVPNLDPMKVIQTKSLTRMKKSYDESQRQIQAAPYDQLGQRHRLYKQAMLVNLMV